MVCQWRFPAVISEKKQQYGVRYILIALRLGFYSFFCLQIILTNMIIVCRISSLLTSKCSGLSLQICPWVAFVIRNGGERLLRGNRPYGEVHGERRDGIHYACTPGRNYSLQLRLIDVDTVTTLNFETRRASLLRSNIGLTTAIPQHVCFVSPLLCADTQYSATQIVSMVSDYSDLDRYSFE